MSSTSPISFGGISSGFDTGSMIDAMMGTSMLRLQRYQAVQSDLKTRKSAFSGLRSPLNDLLAKIQAFSKDNQAAARLAKVGSGATFDAAASAEAISGQYSVRVERLASATAARTVATLGTAITPGRATGTMASLNLSTTAKGGSLGIVVDGVVRKLTIGDPATTSSQVAIDTIASGIEAAIVAGGDAGATVTASVTGNRVAFTMSGAAGTHAVHFGVAGDVSNLAGILGVANAETTLANDTAFTGSALLGVVSTSATLDGAGLSGLASTKTGRLMINGTNIDYDTTTDSLNAVIQRINASSAGVVASLDRANDRIVLARKSEGPVAIDIADANGGTLATALGLAPGTTNAQAIGQTAKLTVNGATVYSDTNIVTTAIAGVTLTLYGEQTAATTVTVGPDAAAVRSRLQALVSAFNSVADQTDALTGVTGDRKTATLRGEDDLRRLPLSLRDALFAPVGASTDAIRALGDLGISTGAVGSKVGTTTRLQFDTARFDKVFAADPERVAAVLDGASGVFASAADRLSVWTTGKNPILDGRTESIDEQLRALDRRIADQQDRMTVERDALERRFSAMESLLGQMQQSSSSLTQAVAQANKSR